MERGLGVLITSMPSKCDECILSRMGRVPGGNSYILCKAENAYVMDKERCQRPRWCRMRRFPEEMIIHEDRYAEGWNDCLRKLKEGLTDGNDQE